MIAAKTRMFRESLSRIAGEADSILRGPASIRRESSGIGVGQLLVWTAACGAFYGAAMGSFGGISGDRAWQIVVAAVKVPLLLLATFGTSLPSFFVLNNLLGVRNDFGVALRALVRAQAGVTLMLAALTPYTLLWYASSANYPQALLFNGGMFAIASAAGQFLLRAWYRPLLAYSKRHRWLLRFWLAIYIFVGIQMAWILRPFIGEPGTPVQFIRAESWGNAYVVVGRLVIDTFNGSR
jgi:hypothetical protein